MILPFSGAFAQADKPPEAAKPADAPQAASQDGKYVDADGNPTFHQSPDGKWDWQTYSGYIRYNANCIVCHGPDGSGSTYAPALADSLKTMDYQTFTTTVVQGKKNVSSSSDLVMPSFGLNKNVMCYLDDVYVYLKARAVGGLGRTRPNDHEPKTKSFRDAEDACMGPE